MPQHREVDYARDLSEEELEQGAHRKRVGSRWDEIGRLQRDFLVAQGLKPEHRLLDVGCGALRGGVWFVEHLDPGHYHGIDINLSLLEAGWSRELPEEMRTRLPWENLRLTDRFESDFGVTFDYAIAQSLFTHVPLNDIRLCLYRVAKVMKPDGRFFATFFEAPDDFPLDDVRPGRRGKWTERNPFLYYRGDLEWAASASPWEFRYLGAWGHPRGQRMVEFRRLTPREEETARQHARRDRGGTALDHRAVRAGKRLARRLPGARRAARSLRRAL
jgi:SAM-dependent methyltransferase